MSAQHEGVDGVLVRIEPALHGSEAFLRGVRQLLVEELAAGRDEARFMAREEARRVDLAAEQIA